MAFWSLARIINIMLDHKNTRNEIAKLERHDWHLWWTAVLVILALTTTIIGFYSPQFVSKSQEGSRPPAGDLFVRSFDLDFSLLHLCAACRLQSWSIKKAINAEGNGEDGSTGKIRRAYEYKGSDRT